MSALNLEPLRIENEIIYVGGQELAPAITNKELLEKMLPLPGTVVRLQPGRDIPNPTYDYHVVEALLIQSR